MRKFLLIPALVYALGLFALDTTSSVPVSLDSMDKMYNKIQKESDDLKDQIAEAEKKIEDAKKDKENTNYWIPIVGGAILGIGLAWYLRRRKN